MNLKLNNDSSSSSRVPNTRHKLPSSYIKEERRRTGRYIAILVGISLLLLACYHAWVRRIPIVASLVVPALIMFVYVGWVLYSAARDKHRLLMLDAEIAKAAAESNENELATTELSSTVEINVISSRERSKPSTAESPSNTEWAEISSTFLKGEQNNTDKGVKSFVTPIILINDKPPDDLDDRWTQIIDIMANNDKIKSINTRRKFKRRFCRSKRYAVFKRSYSIA